MEFGLHVSLFEQLGLLHFGRLCVADPSPQSLVALLPSTCPFLLRVPEGGEGAEPQAGSEDRALG